MLGSMKISQLVAAVCVIVGIGLLAVFRNRNNLSGCGSRHVMESVGLTGSAEGSVPTGSTIFGDLPPFEGEEQASEDSESKEKIDTQEQNETEDRPNNESEE